MHEHTPLAIDAKFEPQTDSRSFDLDLLFQNVRAFRDSKEARELFDFVSRFPKLAPFNAMLIHAQRRGCRMVATEFDWKTKYGRKVKFTATPLVILWSFGPVNFVFDISDTEEIPGCQGEPIPDLAERPFNCHGEVPHRVFTTLMANLPGQGIIGYRRKLGAHMGGSIHHMPGNYFQYAPNGTKTCKVKALYGLQLANTANFTTTFTTMAHELGHLFCGHISARVKDKKMPSRSDLAGKEKEEILNLIEFEAESVAWLVCRRLGVDAPADFYLSGYLKKNNQLPEVNLALILKAVGKIESLYRAISPPRKDLVLDWKNPGAKEFEE